MTWMGAGRAVGQCGEVLFPLHGGQGVAGGGANPLHSVIDVEVPHLGCAVAGAGGQDFPSRLNAIEPMMLAGPVRGCPSGAGWAGSASVHSQTLPSQALAARIFPSGLNATELMPVRGLQGSGEGLAEAGGPGRIGQVPRHTL